MGPIKSYTEYETSFCFIKYLTAKSQPLYILFKI